MPKKAEFVINCDELTFLKKASFFADQFSHFSLFHSNNIPYPHGPFRKLFAIGAQEHFEAGSNSFENLKAFQDNSWLFGYLGYDLKNQVENLESRHHNKTGFSDIGFFKPQILIELNDQSITIHSEDPKKTFEIIINSPEISGVGGSLGPIQAKLDRQDYLETVNVLRQHIEDGDVYEINFCQEFFGQIDQIDPVSAYWALNEKSPKPFSAFQKFNNQYLLCASPERFLKKIGPKLISQPIKGTIKRGASLEEDELLKDQLRSDEKELAENMMIVDLVRNDLAKSSKTGSVKVEEMFGIYTFSQVHQMISTVTSELRDDIHAIDAIKNAFPMGSMTGAPKVKVMELIERYETSRRGIFSGAAGYFSPDGDYDFNVIIRSLFLNLKDGNYSFQVGGAITYDSKPENEYEECLLKASAITEVLKSLSS